MLPDQVQEFLQHHGGDAAVEHKAELLHLTGGNVGKLEALGVKRRRPCTLCSSRWHLLLKPTRSPSAGECFDAIEAARKP